MTDAGEAWRPREGSEHLQNGTVGAGRLPQSGYHSEESADDRPMNRRGIGLGWDQVGVEEARMLQKKDGECCVAPGCDGGKSGTKD